MDPVKSMAVALASMVATVALLTLLALPALWLQ